MYESNKTHFFSSCSCSYFRPVTKLKNTSPPRENRFTAQQMETKRKALEKQLSKQITSSFAVEIEVLDSFKVGDSLIKKRALKWLI